MARPIKNNADYFSHDVGMRNDPKIKFLRSKFGHEGFVFYVMMLEYLASCDGAESEWSVITQKILSGDFSIEEENITKIMNECIDLGLFILKDNKIWSNGLKKRLQSVWDKRERMREIANKRQKQKKGGVSDAETPREVNNTHKSEAEKQQSKVKKSKVKKNINNNSKELLSCEQRGDEKINKIIHEIRMVVEDNQAVYNAGKQERFRAKIIAYEQGDWGKFLKAKNLDPIETIRRIIKYSLSRKFVKRITNAESFHKNWADVINQMRTDAMEQQQKSQKNITNAI